MSRFAIGVDPWSKEAPEDLPCRVQDPDLWFGELPGELEMAKEFCRDCPARPACLRGAVTRREPWGVWGGEIFDRGEIIGRKRPRGRPRRSDRFPLTAVAHCDTAPVAADRRSPARPARTCRIA